MKPLVAFGLLFVLLSVGPDPVDAQSQEAALEAVAAAVRQRGQVCERPQSVEHDVEHSEPDRKAWVILCENARYRVKFMGDTGPEVTQLD